MVYVGGDLEENIDELCTMAGEIGLLGTPCFMFQEGSDPNAERAFKVPGSPMAPVPFDTTSPPPFATF